MNGNCYLKRTCVQCLNCVRWTKNRMENGFPLTGNREKAREFTAPCSFPISLQTKEIDIKFYMFFNFLPFSNITFPPKSLIWHYFLCIASVSLSLLRNWWGWQMSMRGRKKKKEERNTYRNASRNEMLSSDDVEECIHSLREHSMADGKLCIYLVYTRHNNANGNEIASN